MAFRTGFVCQKPDEKVSVVGIFAVARMIITHPKLVALSCFKSLSDSSFVAGVDSAILSIFGQMVGFVYDVAKLEFGTAEQRVHSAEKDTMFATGMVLILTPLPV